MLSRSDARWTLIVSVLALALMGWGLLTRGPLPQAPFEASQPTVQTVDINRAGVPRLEALPGIGPTLAERIVRARLLAGPYRDVDKLARVRGIGPETLQKLRSRLTACGALGCR